MLSRNLLLLRSDEYVYFDLRYHDLKFNNQLILKTKKPNIF